MTHAAASRPVGLTPLEPGHRVAGRYIVKRVLGQGGMGQVVEAELIALGKPCALKVLRLERWNDELVRRFNREARALAKVTSPRVAQVTDFGVDETAGPFYVMELLEGETLEDRIEREGALPPRQALSIALEIAEALIDVHRSALVHRDLKPSNVGLTEHGPVGIKLLDFGLAAALDDTFLSRITQSQQILGSLPYMAPEQFNGASPAPTMDLYALGVVLYEMTSGRMPFMAPSTAALIHQILSSPVPAVAAPCAAVPGFESLVERLLAKAPEDRFPSAIAAVAALRALLEPMGGPAPRPRIPPETRDFEEEAETVALGRPLPMPGELTGSMPPTGAAMAMVGGAVGVMPTVQAASVQAASVQAASNQTEAPTKESGLRLSQGPVSTDPAAFMRTAPSQPAYPLPSESELKGHGASVGPLPAPTRPSPVQSHNTPTPVMAESSPYGASYPTHPAAPPPAPTAASPLGFRLAVVALLGIIFAGLSAIAVVGLLSLLSPSPETESTHAAPVPALAPAPMESDSAEAELALDVPAVSPAPARTAPTPNRPARPASARAEPAPAFVDPPAPSPRERPEPRVATPHPPPPRPAPAPRPATYDPQAIREW